MGMHELKERLLGLRDRLEKIKKVLDLDTERKTLRELEANADKSGFWDDPQTASRVMKQISSIKETIETVEKVSEQIEDALSVIGLPDLAGEVEKAEKSVSKKLDQFEKLTFLSGMYDKNNAILSIHAGQGGTEAMDWAQMLQRMYMMYVQKQNWDIETVDFTSGEEAGIKSITLLISGPFAYGKLKGEAGTHRLVRLSPFNANNLRQTSFALVEVLPELEEATDVDIKEEDLEWQFFRSSSQGGQNVQKVSTAVRLIHNPTGIVVTAQSERFQEQNRKIALGLLRAKLWARQQAIEKEQVKAIKGEYRPASWGNQIRSYVLHPYKLVKDLRTDFETSNTDSVLGGDLDSFIDAELRFFAETK